MDEKIAYLLEPEFDFAEAVAGSDGLRVLRDAEDLVAAATLAWRQGGREGFPPDEFAVWNKVLESFKAARHTLEMLRLKMG